MIAAYFLVVFWLVPLHMVMAIMAERIALSKGMRGGSVFMKVIYLGIGEFVEVCRAPSTNAQYLFDRPFPARMLELTLMITGSASLPLMILCLSFCIPGKFGDDVGSYALILLCAWNALTTIAIPVAFVRIRREIKNLPDKEMPTHKEIAILRNLLIPSAIPLIIANITAFILIGALVVMGLVKVLLTGFFYGPITLFTLSAIVAGVACLAVSPLICHELAEQKQRSKALWVPVGFVLPGIAPLALAMIKTPPDHINAESPCNDLQTALILHAQLLTVVMLITWPSITTTDQVGQWISGAYFSLVATWLVFALPSPFVVTRALKLAPPGLSASRLAIRAAGIESIMGAMAIVLYFIQHALHNDLF